MSDLRYKFNYRLSGNAANPKIVLLHGFMGSLHDWVHVVKKLSDNFYCLHLDLPGHGKTEVLESDDDFGFVACSEGIIEFLDTLDFDRSHLLGYSMGGRIAFFLSLFFPEYFGKVIIESANPGCVSSLERRERLHNDEKLASEIEEADLREFLSKWYAQPLFGNLPSNPAFETLISKRLNNEPEELSLCLKNMGLGNQPSMWERLYETETNYLFIAGELDEKYTSIGRTLQEQNNKIVLKVVENCGHNVHFENPERFVSEVKDFLTR